MAKRKTLSRKQSKSNFRKGTGVKKKNFSTGSMRGGIRL